MLIALQEFYGQPFSLKSVKTRVDPQLQNVTCLWLNLCPSLNNVEKIMWCSENIPYPSHMMAVIEDSLILISTHIVNDSDVWSAAISQANIDQHWLPTGRRINHVHRSNTIGRKACVCMRMFVVAGYKNMILLISADLQGWGKKKTQESFLLTQ